MRSTRRQVRGSVTAPDPASRRTAAVPRPRSPARDDGCGASSEVAGARAPRGRDASASSRGACTAGRGRRSGTAVLAASPKEARTGHASERTTTRGAGGRRHRGAAPRRAHLCSAPALPTRERRIAYQPALASGVIGALPQSAGCRTAPIIPRLRIFISRTAARFAAGCGRPDRAGRVAP